MTIPNTRSLDPGLYLVYTYRLIDPIKNYNHSWIGLFYPSSHGCFSGVFLTQLSWSNFWGWTRTTCFAEKSFLGFTWKIPGGDRCIPSLKLTANAPENGPGPNRKVDKVVFQPSIFRDKNVSFRECIRVFANKKGPCMVSVMNKRAKVVVCCLLGC